MAQKTTLKQTEIQLIKKLFALDGYFTAAFSKDDIVIMEHNINADYDLLCGTTRDESSKLSILRHDLEFTRNELDEKTKLVSDLTAERNQAIGKIKSLEEQGKADEKTIISLQKQICDANREKEAAIENYHAAQKDNDALQDDLYEKSHECERLRTAARFCPS